jgi:hypothetical protein
MTLCARRFGVAVRLASTHERDCEDGTASTSGVAHQSGRRRARSGSVKPRRASICAKVRTTVSAKRLSRYWYSDRYSQTDEGDEAAVVIASQDYLVRLTVACAVLHASTHSSGIFRTPSGMVRHPADHLDPGFCGGSGVLEYIPTGCPAGSLTSPMAPAPFGRSKGNPGTSVPPSSLAFLQLS